MNWYEWNVMTSLAFKFGHHSFFMPLNQRIHHTFKNYVLWSSFVVFGMNQSIFRISSRLLHWHWRNHTILSHGPHVGPKNLAIGDMALHTGFRKICVLCVSEICTRFWSALYVVLYRRSLQTYVDRLPMLLQWHKIWLWQKKWNNPQGYDKILQCLIMRAHNNCVHISWEVLSWRIVPKPLLVTDSQHPQTATIFKSAHNGSARAERGKLD